MVALLQLLRRACTRSARAPASAVDAALAHTKDRKFKMTFDPKHGGSFGFVEDTSVPANKRSLRKRAGGSRKAANAKGAAAGGAGKAKKAGQLAKLFGKKDKNHSTSSPAPLSGTLSPRPRQANPLWPDVDPRLVLRAARQQLLFQMYRHSLPKSAAEVCDRWETGGPHLKLRARPSRGEGLRQMSRANDEAGEEEIAVADAADDIVDEPKHFVDHNEGLPRQDSWIEFDDSKEVDFFNDDEPLEELGQRLLVPMRAREVIVDVEAGEISGDGGVVMMAANDSGFYDGEEKDLVEEAGQVGGEAGDEVGEVEVLA